MASKKKKAPAKKAVKKPAAKPAAKSAKKAPKSVAKKAAPKKAVKKVAAKAAPKKAQPKKSGAKAKVKSIAKSLVKSVVKTLAPVKKAVVAATKAPAVDYSKAITPLADRLVVRAVQSERVTAGGLIIPDSVSTATGYRKAEVLAVGQGAKNKKGQVKALDVQKGDVVLFSEYAGTKVQFNSEELLIINESDVMGIVED